MAQKIPPRNNSLGVAGGFSWAPPAQHAAFAEFREFMGAYCEARLWWMEQSQRLHAEPCRKFWFANYQVSKVCYGIMEAWFRGYWLTKKELGAHVQTGMSNSVFERIMKNAICEKYVTFAAAQNDGRQKVVMPTRATILMFEKFSYQYFKVIAENSHKHNSFTQGLRDRLTEIEAQDDIRKEQLGWSIYDYD